MESLQHFKKPWAHEHEPVKGLLDAVKVRKIVSEFVLIPFIIFHTLYIVSYNSLLQAIKPTVLIGSSGVGKTFTKEVVEAMSSINEVPSHFIFS